MKNVKVFESQLSTKGQLVIVKQIRKQLNLKENQRVLQKIEGKKIILEPAPSILELGGFLEGMEKKPVNKVVKEMKKGWN